jgi:hypothetical protein
MDNLHRFCGAAFDYSNWGSSPHSGSFYLGIMWMLATEQMTVKSFF